MKSSVCLGSITIFASRKRDLEFLSSKSSVITAIPKSLQQFDAIRNYKIWFFAFDAETIIPNPAPLSVIVASDWTQNVSLEIKMIQFQLN